MGDALGEEHRDGAFEVAAQTRGDALARAALWERRVTELQKANARLQAALMAAALDPQVTVAMSTGPKRPANPLIPKSPRTPTSTPRARDSWSDRPWSMQSNGASNRHTAPSASTHKLVSNSTLPYGVMAWPPIA